MTGTIRAGGGDWTFEPWRGVFYPDGLRQGDELSYMSRQLPVIDTDLPGAQFRGEGGHR